jgi:Na+-translocating ferredoxin:NAD+ oxidoreductase subunit G
MATTRATAGRESNSMPGGNISRNAVLLALLALCTTALIALTYHFTRDAIALQVHQAQDKALLQIIPGVRHDNSLLDDTIAVGPQSAGLGLHDNKSIYVARQRGKVVAVLIPVVAPDGYAGSIDLLVGVNRDGSIAGVRALRHSETPGLGDQIDIAKSDWVLGFDGRSLTHPARTDWAVQKDNGTFDQLTGATITTRAVVAAVLRALEFARANRAELFGPDDTAVTGGDT